MLDKNYACKSLIPYYPLTPTLFLCRYYRYSLGTHCYPVSKARCKSLIPLKISNHNQHLLFSILIGQTLYDYLFTLLRYQFRVLSFAVILAYLMSYTFPFFFDIYFVKRFTFIFMSNIISFRKLVCIMRFYPGTCKKRIIW